MRLSMDVADPVVDRVLVRNPGFLHQPALHADLGRDRRHLARMVRLHAADRHQRVGAGGKRVGHDVFELPQLVAAEGEARVAVLALGVELDPAAQMRGQPCELLDRRRAEGQRIAGEFCEHERSRRLQGRTGRKPTIRGAKGALELARRSSG